jgi:hypothetical protein
MSDPKLPCDLVLKHVSKLSLEKDKPIMLDYWALSCAKTVVIGVRSAGEKLLVKNEDEYTSPILKVYKVGEQYIVETENSLYIVSSDIPTKRIS